MTAPTVLIVDDSRLTRTIIKSALGAAGYVIVGEAVNGREGIEMTAKWKPDLVTVDFTMPEKGGLESLEEILAAYPAAKIIVVTALGSQKLLQEDAKKAGALAMIAKPFNPFDLVRIADRLLGRKSSVSEPRGFVLPASESPPKTIETSLTPDQINDLMEVGNIGAGHAASRLSDLIGRRCLISPPQVSFLDPEAILRTFNDDSCFMASLGVKILGEIPAVMVVILRRDQASAVLRFMTRSSKEDSDKKLSSSALFALKRIGEFLTTAFSQAVNQFLMDRIGEAIPEISTADSLENLETFLKEGKGTDPYLLIHCGFSDAGRTFEGKLAYVLPPASQKTVMERLRALIFPVG